jgi:hypothetical protein
MDPNYRDAGVSIPVRRRLGQGLPEGGEGGITRSSPEGETRRTAPPVKRTSSARNSAHTRLPRREEQTDHPCPAGRPPAPLAGGYRRHKDTRRPPAMPQPARPSRPRRHAGSNPLTSRAGLPKPSRRTCPPGNYLYSLGLTVPATQRAPVPSGTGPRPTGGRNPAQHVTRASTGCRLTGQCLGCLLVTAPSWTKGRRLQSPSCFAAASRSLSNMVAMLPVVPPQSPSLSLAGWISGRSPLPLPWCSWWFWPGRLGCQPSLAWLFTCVLFIVACAMLLCRAVARR